MIVDGIKRLQRFMDEMQTSIRARFRRLSSLKRTSALTPVDLPGEHENRRQQAFADVDRQSFPEFVSEVECVSAYGDGSEEKAGNLYELQDHSSQ